MEEKHPLFTAAQKGDCEILKRYHRDAVNLDIEDEDGNTLFLCAIQHGQLEAAKLLCQITIDVKKANKKGQNAMHMASHNGHDEIIRWLMTNGFDVITADKKQFMPMHYAAIAGNVSCMKTLHGYGASYSGSGLDGTQPIHTAAFCGQRQTVHFLIEECDADMDAVNHSGLSTTFFAASGNQINIVKYLARRGAQLDQPTWDNFTALHLAAALGHKDLVEFFCENGVDPYLEDGDGNTVLMIANRFKNDAILIYLNRYKPKLDTESDDNSISSQGEKRRKNNSSPELGEFNFKRQKFQFTSSYSADSDEDKQFDYSPSL